MNLPLLIPVATDLVATGTLRTCHWYIKNLPLPKQVATNAELATTRELATAQVLSQVVVDEELVSDLVS
ncbi:hypothetical protein L1987_17961 [Smallanthus sonchifolius]|uniref:Uncharacterized protein n=1 Tax=Smallanthus sonchifolius TaxID=185202 RepID=A0ACB9IZH0_9ASTR|nr:hypothetical protein L1987_17961 [Smallanthus sonchifolius]